MRRVGMTCTCTTPINTFDGPVVSIVKRLGSTFSLICLGDVRNSRRGTGEEGKYRKCRRTRLRKKLLNRRHDQGRRNRDRIADYLRHNMCRYAQRTVGMRDIAARMAVRHLNRAAQHDKRKTQQPKEESPRCLAMRFWAETGHTTSTIAHQTVCTRPCHHDGDRLRGEVAYVLWSSSKQGAMILPFANCCLPLQQALAVPSQKSVKNEVSS